MGRGDHEGELGRVYAASSPQDIGEIYDRWSATYDDYMATVGYRHPAICVALLARHVPAGDAAMPRFSMPGSAPA